MDSYDSERTAAADVNLAITSRTADFISPKSGASRALRDATLALAETEPFARRLINSGRLSTPASYEHSPLTGPDGFAPDDRPTMRPGAAASDTPLAGGWLLDRLGAGFTGAWFGHDVPAAEAAQAKAELAASPLPTADVVTIDEELACRRYGAEIATAFYLFRPDGHIAARWRTPTHGAVAAALAKAAGLTGPIPDTPGPG
jgi:3-(3-hydroxy-phenyl)propionate hydroxylase